jgi:hypothetical protein
MTVDLVLDISGLWPLDLESFGGSSVVLGDIGMLGGSLPGS